MTIALESRPTRANQVLTQRADDTIILLNPRNGEYYTLEEVGARVWDLCDGSHRVADVVSLIHAEYEAPLDAISADVLELLQDLARETLVVDE